MQNPGSEIKMTSKTQKGMKTTFMEIWKKIVEDAPKGCAPKWSTKDDCYIFPNGTRFHIHGTDNQRYENLRGDRCDLALVDEAAFCTALRYIVMSVLLPQTLTCNGRIIIMSTPEQKATASGEEFKNFCIEAQLRGSYFHQDIYANTTLLPETIQEYKDLAGGEDSIEWQVEYLCKFKIDPDKAIVAEWRTDKFVLPEEFTPDSDPFFQFYHKYTVLDLGVKRDWTVGLCAYYDFSAATLMVLNEFYVKNTTTPEIAKLLKETELEVFGSSALYRRVCDSDNPQLVNDFVHLHKIGISAVEKTTLEAMVNSMKILVGCNQVRVHPRCKLLIKTLVELGCGQIVRLGD